MKLSCFLDLSLSLSLLTKCLGDAGTEERWTLQSLLFRDGRNLKDSQKEAQYWLNDNPDLDSVAESQQAQQLAMATFFYATHGPESWRNQTDWLSYTVNECQWFNLAKEDSCDSSSNLIELDLEFNGLEGTLPTTIGDLSFLQFLDLYDNNITGTFPTEIARVRTLVELELGANDFEGTIPSQLSNLTSLKMLSLEDNLITGTIPSDLSKASSLEEIYLAGNSGLGGSLPASLGTLVNLTTLDISKTGIIGTIPTALCSITELIFTCGTIIGELCGCTCDCTKQLAPPTNGPTKAPTKKPTKAPTKAPTKSPTKKPTKQPTRSPTQRPTPAPTEFGSVCRLCPNTIDVGSSGKTLFEMGSGGTTTCGDFNAALSLESSCNNVGYTGTFRGVDVAAYCDCPGTSDPAACGRGLCNEGSSLVGQGAFGLTCSEWDDFALAAVSSDACGSMLDPQRASCCVPNI